MDSEYINYRGGIPKYIELCYLITHNFLTKFICERDYDMISWRIICTAKYLGGLTDFVTKCDEEGESVYR